jgi:purine-nucleoside phosphorylase
VAGRCPYRPPVGIVTGSGFDGLLERVEGTNIPWNAIRGFPRPSVTGHPGVLVMTPRLAVMGGRLHAYEGWTAEEVALPVRLLQRLGVQRLILTNAAGGIREGFAPGTLVLIRDQINLTGLNPLRGAPPRERFCDMTDAYSRSLRDMARNHFPELPEGVYAGLSGPSYETPAEIDMLERLGADLVGMSTVLETITARSLGMEVLGLSLVSNRAAGRGAGGIAHGEVIAAGRAAAERTTHILLRLADLLAGEVVDGGR